MELETWVCLRFENIYTDISKNFKIINGSTERLNAMQMIPSGIDSSPAETSTWSTPCCKKETKRYTFYVSEAFYLDLSSSGTLKAELNFLCVLNHALTLENCVWVQQINTQSTICKRLDSSDRHIGYSDNTFTMVANWN